MAFRFWKDHCVYAAHLADQLGQIGQRPAELP
jgi:hypothetical protein